MAKALEPSTYGAIFYVAALLVSAVVSIIILFKLLRPYFNKKVVCWFCAKPSSVPYGNRNCWDCPHCEQYNGFTKDGGYNKPIPSQYNEDLNYPINCTKSVSNFQMSNKLCEQCTRNQTLKIKQLANFTPTNEARFDEEVDVYKSRLERVYRLCFTCQRRLNDELRRQNDLLRPRLIKHMQRRRLSPRQPASTEPEQAKVSPSMRWISLSLKLISISLILINYFLVLYSLPMLSEFRVGAVTSVHQVLNSYRLKLQLSGLLLQLSIVLFNFLCQRSMVRDLLHCVLWLLCYGHGVLTTHLLLPKLLASPLLSATLLTALLISTYLHRSADNSSTVSSSRPPSPSDSQSWSSLVSNHSCSGVSEGHPNMNDVTCEEYEAMDCTASELSTLNLGDTSPVNSQYSYARPSTPAPHMRPSALSSNRSSYGGSMRSFRTAAPSMSNSYQPPLVRSPSRNSVYSQPARSLAGYDVMSNHLSTPPSVSGYMPSNGSNYMPSNGSNYMPSNGSNYMSSNGSNYMPPSVSNYMSAGSSPDSPTSTVYSHMVPLNQRISPEKTSLLTQVMLGISLGVNISIGAFILGRYSVNGDLLSFI